MFVECLNVLQIKTDKSSDGVKLQLTVIRPPGAFCYLWDTSTMAYGCRLERNPSPIHTFRRSWFGTAWIRRRTAGRPYCGRSAWRSARRGPRGNAVRRAGSPPPRRTWYISHRCNNAAAQHNRNVSPWHPGAVLGGGGQRAMPLSQRSAHQWPSNEIFGLVIIRWFYVTTAYLYI